jgi:hypothetical protein
MYFVFKGFDLSPGIAPGCRRHWKFAVREEPRGAAAIQFYAH